MKATLPEPEIVTHKGKPVSVILPIKHYQELLERVEDIRRFLKTNEFTLLKP